MRYEAAAIAAELLDLTGERPADHLLVDEGQDLNLPQWQLLRALAATGPDDLFIAEDAQQRIYGQRVVLGRLGVKIVGRSRRLALNYRTTAQNLHFAVGILDGTYVGLEDDSEDATGFRSARSGPQPRLLAAATLTDELQKAADVVVGWLEENVAPPTIGILVRDSTQASQVSRGLEERQVPVRVVTNQTTQVTLPQVMTMHRAKGMEFSRVLIFGAEKGLVPASWLLKDLGEADRADALQRERSLFYVAATRARDELVVLWSGEPTALLPART
jgi:superfamily I DNA/RNA helicase